MAGGVSREDRSGRKCEPSPTSLSHRPQGAPDGVALCMRFDNEGYENAKSKALSAAAWVF